MVSEAPFKHYIKYGEQLIFEATGRISLVIVTTELKESKVWNDYLECLTWLRERWTKESISNVFQDTTS